MPCDFCLRHNDRLQNILPESHWKAPSEMWGVTKPQRFPDSFRRSGELLPNTPLLWFWQQNMRNEIPEPASSVLHLFINPPTAAWVPTLPCGELYIVRGQTGMKLWRFSQKSDSYNFTLHNWNTAVACSVGYHQLSLQITVDVTQSEWVNHCPLVRGFSNCVWMQCSSITF